MRVVLTLLCLVAVGLAGCTSNEAPISETEAVDPDSFQLQAGKGAIAGLLVDDRFRPVHVTADPQTSEQFAGFVLLQETGQQTGTTSNGEFTFTDLEPGTYTIRIQVDGHEVTPTRAQVQEGLFAESNVIARRVAGEAGFIISNEYAAFVPCGANIIFFGTSLDCTFDQSGDSERVAFTYDYSSYNATHLVMEMTARNPDYYDIWLQSPGNQVCSGAYQIMGGPSVDYLRFQLNLNESAISSEGASGQGCETLPWLNDEPLETVVYLNSIGFEQGVGFGAGVYYGLQANFVQNTFVGEPSVDVDTFCVYCSES